MDSKHQIFIGELDCSPEIVNQLNIEGVKMRITILSDGDVITFGDTKWFICDSNGVVIENSIQLNPEHVNIYKQMCRSKRQYLFRFECHVIKKVTV